MTTVDPENDAAPVTVIEPWEVKPEQQIGKGATSIVFLGEFAGQKVAIKEIIGAAEGRITKRVMKPVERELQVLTQVTHPNIVQFIGIVNDPDNLRIVMEYCSGGSVFRLLHNRWAVQISWAQRFKILLDTSSASAHLHNYDPPILHRDLKSLNLLLRAEFTGGADETPHVKLTDFGFARVSSEQMTQSVGTTHWMAPEVMSTTTYTQKADIFSFAMVAYEVTCRQVPFEKLTPVDVRRELSSGNRPGLSDPNVVPKDTPIALVNIITECWAQDPLERPSFDDIYAALLTCWGPTAEHHKLSL